MYWEAGSNWAGYDDFGNPYGHVGGVNDDVFFPNNPGSVPDFHGNAIDLHQDEAIQSIAFDGARPWQFASTHSLEVITGQVTVGAVNTTTLDLPFKTPLALTKTGDGALILGGPITIGGPIYLNGGTLNLAGPTTLAGGLIISSGTAVISSSQQFAGDLVIGKGGTLSADADDRLGASGNIVELRGGTFQASGTFTTTRTILLGAGGSGGIGVTAGNQLTIASILSRGTLVKIGAGTLALASPNTYQGGTRILEGTLRMTPGGAIGPQGDPAMANQAVVSIGPQGTLDLGGADLGLGQLKDDRTGGGGQVLMGTGTLTLGALGADGSFSGTISGPGRLVLAPPTDPLASPATITLSGNNTFSGGAAVKADTLLLSGPQSFTGGLVASAGATVAVASDASLGAASNSLTLDGGTLHVTGGFTTGRALALTPSGGTVDVGAGTLTFSGNLSRAGMLTKVGPGMMRITGSDAVAAPIAIRSGTLAISGPSGSTAATSFKILHGGELLIDDSTASGGSPAAGSRFGSRVSVTLAGGTIDIAGTDGAASNETFGGLSLLGSSSRLVLEPGAGGSVAVRFASLAALQPAALLDVTAADLGNTERVWFDVPPTSSGGGRMPYWLTVAGQPAFYDATHGLWAGGSVAPALLPGDVPEPLAVPCLISAGLLCVRTRRR